MSTRPADPLIEAVLEADVLGDAVERHLDAYPIPVDEDELARATERLLRRMPARRSAPRMAWVALGVLALAAVAAVVLRAAVQQPMLPDRSHRIEILELDTIDHPVTIRLVDRPGTIYFDGPGRSLTVGVDSEALTSVEGRVAVVLVQRGEAESDGVRIPEAHWAVLTRVHGQPQQVVFPDGQAPPPLTGPAWEETSVQTQLRELRWQSLPERTLETLDRLLED